MSAKNYFSITLITTLIIILINSPSPVYATSGTATVISTLPASGQTQVDPESAIYVTFDLAMDPATFTPANCKLTVKNSTQQVNLLSIHYEATNPTNTNPSNPIAVLIPAAPLKLSTDYQVILTTGVQDSNNTPLVQDYTWSFKTADSPQAVVPSVILTTPLPGDSMVSLSKLIQASFNHDMDSRTINNSTFVLKDSVGNPVAAQSISYDLQTRTAKFTPTTNLKPNENYQVMITKDVKETNKDINGNEIPLAQDFNWSFTTGTTPYFSPHGNYIANSAACKSCHQTHTAEGKGLLNKSTQTQVCYTCHDGSGSSTNIRQIMNPSIESLSKTQSYHPIMDTGNPNVPSTLQCTDCHNPHGDQNKQGEDYPNLLRASDGTTTAYQGVDFCIVCHNSKDSKGWDKSAFKSSIHYDQGIDCSTCHASHSSANPNLNVQSANNQCLSCHTTVKIDFSQTYRHQAECANCHDPHTLTTGNITLSPGNELCFKCHASTQYGTPSQSDNTSSGFSNALQPNLHNFSGSSGGHVGLDCSSCHVLVSHGYFRKGLVGSTNDNNPLVGENNKITDIDSGAETGLWQHVSCTTSCHIPEPVNEPIYDSGA
ncbi:Ig-like domain-containing protein [Desulfosporosinus sp. OT]|uniref:Ig-like domain-containing protein n=1 Tax=Desulfosporosinus sp. OT TaxID=913865 RepID=UPI000223AF45|nr:Ig-like domain-containing protein [Desulfosporosinus sp. OT]EGW38229.1 doubled CXXCH domain protein [Desulfosporosinus sp. OT]